MGVKVLSDPGLRVRSVQRAQVRYSALVRSLLLIVLVSGASWGFELERLTLNSGARETWLAQTGDGLEPMRMRVSLLGHYEHRPLVLTADGVDVGAAVSSRWTMHLLGAFGIHKFIEVGLQLPMVLTQGGDDLSTYGIPAVTSTALGAPWLSVRSTFLRQSEGMPMDLALSLNLSFPLGNASALTLDPGVGFAFAPRLGLGRAFGVMRVGAELGALIRGSETLSPTNPSPTDQVGSQFSGALVLSTHGLPIQAELAGRVNVPFTSTGVSVEVLAALRYTFLKQFELSLLGGPGIGKAPGTPAFRVLFGFSWTPDFSGSN